MISAGRAWPYPIFSKDLYKAWKNILGASDPSMNWLVSLS